MKMSCVACQHTCGALFFFLSTSASLHKRPWWALPPGVGRVSAAQVRACADGLLFAHSRDESPQAPAAVCPFCSEESYRLHFVVCHPDHHAHQVRTTPSVTRCHLCHHRLLCTNPAEQGGPSVRLLGSIAFETITCCLAETYGGGSGST